MSEPQSTDLRGYLYKNKNKTRPEQPDFTGKATIKGEVWSVSAWENKDKKTGETYLKLSYSVPKPRTEGAPAQSGAQKSSSPGNPQASYSAPKSPSVVTPPDSFRPTPAEAAAGGNALDDIEKLFGAGTSGTENESPFG